MKDTFRLRISIAYFAEYFPVLVMLRVEWWRAQAAQAAAQMMTLSPVPWGPGLWLVQPYHVTRALASDWSDLSCPLRLAHWEGRDIYFVFTRHRVGKYTNNPASLSQYLWGQSSHNWLKTKQCVVHSLNSRKFTTKKYIFSAEFTTISWRVRGHNKIYDKCGHKYCHWVADSTKNICPSDGKY